MDQSKKPIAYANIGIPNTSIGTILDEDGSFSFIPSQNAKDTLRFSAIGFAKRNVPILINKRSDFTVYLKERSIQLKEVTVVSKKEKNKTFELGNRIFRGGVLQTDTLYAGSAFAILIKASDKSQKDFSFPVYLQKARVWVY